MNGLREGIVEKFVNRVRGQKEDEICAIRDKIWKVKNMHFWHVRYVNQQGDTKWHYSGAETTMEKAQERIECVRKARLKYLGEMKMKELILLRHIPGAGSSTLGEALSEDGKYPVYAADDYFVGSDGMYRFDATQLSLAHKYCQRRTEGSMRNGMEKIIVTNTFTSQREMKEYYDMAAQHGYTVHSVIVENRHGGCNQHGVPDEALHRMRDRFHVQL